MTVTEFKAIFNRQTVAQALFESDLQRVNLTGLSGSAFAVLLSGALERWRGVHVAVMEDRDEAAYLYNDLFALFEEAQTGQILFFPTAYKRSVIYGQEDPSGIVQRTGVLSTLKNRGESDPFLVICTYPEALLERVVGQQRLSENSFTLSKGEKASIAFVSELLAEYRFERVDFVYEPGQYSVRGGIVDIFSFADNKPYRIDFFGDEIDSIRTFNINTQLSVDLLQRVDIVPNFKNDENAAQRVSLMEFIDAGVVTKDQNGLKKSLKSTDKRSKIAVSDTPLSAHESTTYWVSSPDHTLKRLQESRVKMLKDAASKGDAPDTVTSKIIGSKEFVDGISTARLVTCQGDFGELPAEQTFVFATTPQPSFNKNFDILAGNLTKNQEDGYRTLILTPNKAQLERLGNIFNSIGKGSMTFENVPITLHRGFVDSAVRCCFYTDHQIFDRYHRYQIRGELEKSDILTLKELNSLQVGDYVVHIDHGVGRFGGLVRSVENGKVQESIKLTYKDNDVLLVSVHALHRISKYKDKESDAPKIHKLGSGAWQRLKTATKSKVKDIAKDLIALYAKRRATQGFSFTPDSYLQYELEASFIYEDTPDQEKATQAVKGDMESRVPMDRLVCGDVGFGKTEIAIRAAFKAVCDGKQVAVLVPTTVLSLQHYRTFNDRLKEFPVRIENLSRAKSAKQTTEILNELKEGKIDILVGTHKILSNKVIFKDLGLLVIDEEQKFGVTSKEKLRHLRANIDTLTLTATPIPRTLQFSLMGARDLSIINTPPPNRQPVATECLLFSEELIQESINQELQRGGQVFFVHNRVQTIEHMRAIVERLCPDARVAVGHGQMPPEKLEKVMMDFIYGEYDVLIATTIIESGIDISNANTMIINNAHHFGLSELHQLRGRVGRTNRKAYCYLLTPPQESVSDTARRRLRAIEEFADLGSGFNIAMQDLDIRGAGNMLGAEQSGFIADIGFETYQKILNEAIMELKDEESELFAETTTSDESPSDAESTTASNASMLSVTGDSDTSTRVNDATSGAHNGIATAKNALATERQKEAQRYISDCYIDLDREAIIPDTYVGNTAEKLRLYRELDNITTTEQMAAFEGRLMDRFGALPAATRELLDVIVLRQLCVRLGFEKAIVKNGIFILQFVHNQSSQYYKTPLFSNILHYLSAQGDKFRLKHAPDKLSVSIRGVGSCGEAVQVLQKMSNQVEK